MMFIVKTLVLVYYFDMSISIVWNKSQYVGPIDNSDVVNRQTVRRNTECAIYCAINSQCESFVFDISSNKCTLLAVHNQAAPVFTSSTAFHYSKTPFAGCPIGYHLLPKSNACVRLFQETKRWNESRTACLNDGADLPVLNTEIVYYDFLRYMRSMTRATRVAVYGYVSNSMPYWNDGALVDIGKICNWSHLAKKDHTYVYLWYVPPQNVQQRKID